MTQPCDPMCPFLGCASCEFAGGEIPAAASWVPREGQAHVIREAVRRERAEARRVERAPRLRARLDAVEARIRQLDPPTRGDGAVVNVPLARRMPTDNQIAELARLVHERDRLRAAVGA